TQDKYQLSNHLLQPRKNSDRKDSAFKYPNTTLAPYFFGEPAFAYPQNTPFVKSGRKDKDFCYTAKKYFKKINRRHIGGDGVWKNTGH
ncbi:MAG: hypothetical protein KDC70_14145, partial [Saprospiraceae bacterium]|nr:hypothetical protein [Saprospiraceae bacterium]